jgi:membrane protein implicated in regulation of membrane protease activity
MFFINYQTLTFVEFPYEIVTFAFFDIQAVAIAAALSGRAKLPSKEMMQEEHDQTRRERGSVILFHVLGF